MKTAKLIKTSASVLILSLITTLTACGNNGGGGNSAPVVQQNNVCGVNVSCQPAIGGNTFFQSESQDWYGYLKLNLTFTALNPIQSQPMPTPSYPYGGGYIGGSYPGTNGSPIITYAGPVSSAGVLTVMQNLSSGYCQLPVGTYNLMTVSPGQWTSAMVYGLRMQASGPTNAVISIQQAQVGAKTGIQLGQTWSEINPVGRLFGNVSVESVNGYPCNISVLVQ